MKVWISDRTKNLIPSASVSIADKVRMMKSRGLDIVELQTGEPDFPTPDHIIQAAYEAMQQGNTHYVSSRGIPQLREAIAEKLSRDNGIVADAEREILVTPGAVHGVFAAIAASIDPGDEVIIPDPSWVAYPGCVALAGGVAVPVPCHKGTFEVDIDRLGKAVGPRTKLMILNYPSNPAGTSVSLDQLLRIRDIAVEKDLLVLSDEVYEAILYDGRKHYSIASLEGMGGRTITVNSFSKTYAMTGWRIGYACADARILDEMLKVLQYSVTCVAAFAQKAALTALRGSQECVREMVSEYDRRRQIISTGLNGIDRISCPQPQGTFYAFADISQLGLSSLEAAEFLLQEAGVGVVPGSAYGSSGEGYLRLSFANSVANIEKALQRIKEAVARLGT